MCRLLLSFLFSLLNVSLFAQGMIPMTGTISTPRGNVPYTYYVPNPINPLHVYGGGQTTISYKHTFTVVLQDGSVLTDKARIEIQKEGHTINFGKKGQEQVLMPNDTKQLSRLTNDGKLLKGIPADTCWLFKTKAGVIHQYSFLAEENSPYVIAIQKRDNGSIMALNKQNLVELMPDANPKVKKLIEEGKLLKAVDAYNRFKSKEKK